MCRILLLMLCFVFSGYRRRDFSLHHFLWGSSSRAEFSTQSNAKASLCTGRIRMHMLSTFYHALIDNNTNNCLIKFKKALLITEYLPGVKNLIFCEIITICYVSYTKVPHKTKYVSFQNPMLKNIAKQHWLSERHSLKKELVG